MAFQFTYATSGFAAGVAGVDRIHNVAPAIRVLFDAHQIGRRQTGNETYVRESLRALRGRDDMSVVAAVDAGVPGQGPLAPPMSVRRVPRNGWLRLLALGIAARRDRVDLIHSIYYRPPYPGVPTVVAIHDISYERYPEFFGRLELFKNRLLIRDAARRATHVVTLSEHARREIVELYGVDPERITVVYGGVAPVFQAGDDRHREPLRGRELRLLAVGTLQPRKNLLRLLEAVRAVAAIRPARLGVVGPDGFQADRIRAAAGDGAPVDVLGYLSDEELAAEYRRADVFVYPSIYEGFGLPVVEAMASGTPTVTTTGGSLPEIAGDAALIVDPYDVAGLSAAILRLAEDDGLRSQLAERGRARAALFSWERAAEQLRHVYERALDD